MTPEDRRASGAGVGGPPPMDESWWEAILNDDQAPVSTDRPSSSGSPPHTSQPVGAVEDWLWARELYEADETIKLPVMGCNRGGLLVEARSLRGFVPISHLVTIDQTADEDVRAHQLTDLVGNELSLKIIEYDPERGRLVLSERAALAGPGKRIELLENLHAGDNCSGMVTNITKFGVFVDLGGVEGLIHVSELSWGRVRHPKDVVQCGDEVEVRVISVDQEQSRIALSMKELLPDPWINVSERYTVGEIVEGVVTNVVKFGAFVGLEEGLEGLIHVSELGDGEFLHPRSVIQESERVRARIIHIDPEGRRLGLSLRHVQEFTSESPEGAEEATQKEAISSV